MRASNWKYRSDIVLPQRKSKEMVGPDYGFISNCIIIFLCQKGEIIWSSGSVERANFEFRFFAKISNKYQGVDNVVFYQFINF
jgi:hypothetical protein